MHSMISSVRLWLLQLVLLVGLLPMAGVQPAWAEKDHGRHVTISGDVESAGTGLGSYRVTLYRTQPGRHVSSSLFWGSKQGAERIGYAVSKASGRFEIRFRMPSQPDTVLYLVARRGPVALATVLGSIPSGEVTDVPLARRVVINELTTVATGFSLAQFLKGNTVSGNIIGLRNASLMVRNLVDVTSGEPGSVIATQPNGDRTSTFATFNTMANLVANCVAVRQTCFPFLNAARGEYGRLPDDTLHAVANIARNPWRNVADLYQLSTSRSGPYAPKLDKAPNAWTIALKFMGDGKINGPGNFAFDPQGNAWLLNNYTPGTATTNVCSGKTLYRFLPNGTLYPGAPYTGGGVEGAGYGISFDPLGRLWVGNYGFESPVCSTTDQAAKHNSVSVFNQEGEALSPKNGFTAGNIFWPQGTVSDRKGNIWIANCGNSSVTLYPKGNPKRARNFSGSELGLKKPFDIAIDQRGFAWVTGNDSNSVAVIGRDKIWKITGPFDRPMGIATDSRGNMWVANSSTVNLPCPNGGRATDTGPIGSVTLIGANGSIARGAPFTGGGLAAPWGITVDGNDNVWVANFGSVFGEGGSRLVRLSQLCGTDVSKCPAGLRTGDPISPATGYTSEGLTRMTAVQVDMSGNLWVTNNWKLVPIQNNPGGNSIMIFVGMAGPVKAPLIGPPQQP